MDRAELLRQAFDRSAVLELDNSTYRHFVTEFFALMLRWDLGTEGDITSRTLIRGNPQSTAKITAKEAGVIAGLAEAAFLYTKNGVQGNPLVADGDKVKIGTAIMELKGDRKAILMLERTAINAIQRMSGIATLTAKLAKRSVVPIAATRKTLWGFLDKKAVAVGGGLTHRLNAEEAILIKSSHIDSIRESGTAHQIDAALAAAWAKRGDSVFIEMEARNAHEAIAAAKLFTEFKLQDPDYPLLIMFDNCSPAEIKKAIAAIQKGGWHHAALFEASGGITERNIAQFSKTGVDVLSLGMLTHSAMAFNVSQRLSSAG